MQNSILNRLAPISNPINEKRKNLVCPFLIALFLRPISLNKDVFLFSELFWIVGKFLPIQSKAEQLGAVHKARMEGEGGGEFMTKAHKCIQGERVQNWSIRTNSVSILSIF